MYSGTQGVSNAAKLLMRLARYVANVCNFTKITQGVAIYTRFAQGIHIFVIQELAVIFRVIIRLIKIF